MQCGCSKDNSPAQSVIWRDLMVRTHSDACIMTRTKGGLGRSHFTSGDREPALKLDGSSPVTSTSCSSLLPSFPGPSSLCLLPLVGFLSPSPSVDHHTFLLNFQQERSSVDLVIPGTVVYRTPPLDHPTSCWLGF